MNVVKTELDGVIVILKGDLKKSRSPGVIATFTDKFSNETMKITKDTVRDVRGAKTKGGGKESCLTEVKRNEELVEEWNACFDGVDFVEHIQRTILHAQKFGQWKSSPSISSSLVVKASGGGLYRIPIEFRHNIEREQNLSILEAWKRFGFNLKNPKTKTIIAEHTRTEGFNDPEAFLNYLQQLSEEHKQVGTVLDKLLAVLDKNNLKQPLAESESFINSIKASIEELKTVFRERCEKKLVKILDSIAYNPLITRAVE